MAKIKTVTVTDPDYFPRNVLQSFVPGHCPERKRSVLYNGLRGLKRVQADRAWEDWQMILNAFYIITEDVAAEVNEPNPRNVDTSKGSPFQRKFLARWEQFEALLGGNHKPLGTSNNSWFWRFCLS
jgi:hypothetical protein